MRRTGKAVGTLAAATSLAVVGGGLAFADTLADNVLEAQGGQIGLTAGSATGGIAKVQVNQQHNDGDDHCNIDAGEKITVQMAVPAGVTASPASFDILGCGGNNAVTVTFNAGSNAVSGDATASITFNSTGAGTFANEVRIPIVVTHPNTPPTVSVAGVQHEADYEVNFVPSARCDVHDAEDTNESAFPVPSGTLTHGLGAQTVTCTYTDGGGITRSDSKTYTIVDTGDPTASGSVSPQLAAGAAWYNSASGAPTVTFACADSKTIDGVTRPGSGISSCVADGASPASSAIVLGEGASQTVGGTATDNAGNTGTGSVAGLNVDTVAPTNITFGSTGVQDGGSYLRNAVPAKPTCSASDTTSGLASCAVSNTSNVAGAHTLTATATDNAGNTATAQISYTVRTLTISVFASPVDGNNVLNVIKGGNTLPLKFTVRDGSNERTDTAVVSRFESAWTTCSSGATDEVEEFTTAGSTSLRYDNGQFIQNWKTPTGAGKCLKAIVTTVDGSSQSVLVKLK